MPDAVEVAEQVRGVADRSVQIQLEGGNLVHGNFAICSEEKGQTVFSLKQYITQLFIRGELDFVNVTLRELLILAHLTLVLALGDASRHVRESNHFLQLEVPSLQIVNPAQFLLQIE